MKKKKIEAVFSLSVDAVDGSWELEDALNDALKKKFGGRAEIGGAGTGFGMRDYSIYTALADLPAVYKFSRSFARRRKLDPEMGTPTVWVDGMYDYSPAEFEEEYGISVTW